MSFCGDREPAPALTEQRSSLACFILFLFLFVCLFVCFFPVLQRCLLKRKMRTKRFLILPEEKRSKGTWETTSSLDEVIDSVALNCVFGVIERSTFELNWQCYY